MENVILRLLDISDVTADFGEFDYIIAHGIYSWVPAAVRDKFCVPEIMTHFEEYSPSVGTSRDVEQLETGYADMPARNFSSDVLSRSSDRMAVMKLQAVLWSDWGKPERIFHTLQQMNLRPSFPEKCLTAC